MEESACTALENNIVIGFLRSCICKYPTKSTACNRRFDAYLCEQEVDVHREPSDQKSFSISYNCLPVSALLIDANPVDT